MIFVTGGTGFLGSHLLMQLCEQGKKVRALKRRASDLAFVSRLFSFYHKDSLLNRIEWVEGNILDFYSLIPAMKDCEQVYHCAASVGFSNKDTGALTKNNIQGTQNVVNAALETGIKKMCHVSSIAVLGKEALITDDTFWDAGEKHSAYAESKYKAEQEVWRGVAEGLDVVVVRPSVIIGPWKQQGGIGVLFREIESGLKFYTPGSTAYVDVNDVARAMIALTESPAKNDSFIVSAENMTYLEIISTIAQIIGKPAPRWCAGRFLSGLAWRLFVLKDFVTRGDSGFNEITAEISQTTSLYSNKKLRDTINFTYSPIRESLINVYKFNSFLSEKKS